MIFSGQMALGELLGAGMCISIGVVGLVAYWVGFDICANQDLLDVPNDASTTARPSFHLWIPGLGKVDRIQLRFLRDIFTFMVALLTVLVVLLDQKVTLVESLVLIGLYGLFVLSVVVEKWWYTRWFQHRLGLSGYESGTNEGMDTFGMEYNRRKEEEIRLMEQAEDDLLVMSPSPSTSESNSEKAEESLLPATYKPNGGIHRSSLKSPTKATDMTPSTVSLRNEYQFWNKQQLRGSSSNPSYRRIRPDNSQASLVISPKSQDTWPDTATGSKSRPPSHRPSVDTTTRSSLDTTTLLASQPPHESHTHEHWDDFILPTKSSISDMDDDGRLVFEPARVQPVPSTDFHFHSLRPRSPWIALIHALIPIWENWSMMTWFERMVELWAFSWLRVLLIVTVPVIDLALMDDLRRRREIEKEVLELQVPPVQSEITSVLTPEEFQRRTAYLDANFPEWSKPVFLCQCLAIPVFYLIMFGLYESVTWIVISCISSVVFFTVAWRFTSYCRKPSWFNVRFWCFIL